MKTQQLTQVLKADTHRKRVVRAYFMIFIAAVIYTIGIQGFIQEAKVFSAGLGAFAQLPTMLSDPLLDYFSLFYLAFNLPLIIIFWKKNKAKFMYRTMFFLIVQTGLGSLFFIPELKDLFSNVLNLQGGKDAVLADRWPILVLTLIGSVFVASSMALSWKFGGSTAGTDIIAYYYSTKKQKSVGSVMFMLSMIIVTISFTITIGVNKPMREHWLMSIVSTFAYIMLSSIIVDKLYPKFKKVEVRIISNKAKEIAEALSKDGYNHSWRVSDFISRRGHEGQEITTVAFWLETKEMIKIVRRIDPTVWISLNEVRAVYGKFNAPKLEH